MAGAYKGPNGPIRNLGVWRPIDDCPHDEKVWVIALSEGSSSDGMVIMRSDITRAHNIKYWTPLPTVPSSLTGAK